MDAIPTERLARCIAASKQVRWDIDLDVIRGRAFDTSKKYLPDGLSLVAKFATLSKDEKRFVSAAQHILAAIGEQLMIAIRRLSLS